MDTTYTMETRISSYEVGPSRRLRPSVALMLMQEAAGLHLEGDGLSYERMRQSGAVFLLVREAVRAARWPGYGERVAVRTWFERTAGARFLRGFRFTGKAGEELLAAQSVWVLADPRSHRVLRPKEFPFTLPEAGEGAPVEERRLRLPSGAAPAGVREVRLSDIDCNGHMNNAVYADLLCDYFPGGLGNRELSAFQIDYEAEATRGERIELAAAPAPEGGALLAGAAEGRRCFTGWALAE